MTSTSELPDLDPRLKSWLKTATENLAEDGKQRVIAEITSHYEEALSDRLAEGMAPDVAHESVMRSLGSPQTASKQFRKVYLTEEEVKTLDRFRGVWVGPAIESAGGEKALGFVMLVLAAPVVLVLATQPLEGTLPLLCGIGGVLSLFALFGLFSLSHFLVSRCLFGRISDRNAVRIMMLANVLFLSVGIQLAHGCMDYFFNVPNKIDQMPFSYCFDLVWISVFINWNLWRISRKLGKRQSREGGTGKPAS